MNEWGSLHREDRGDRRTFRNSPSASLAETVFSCNEDHSQERTYNGSDLRVGDGAAPTAFTREPMFSPLVVIYAFTL